MMNLSPLQKARYEYSPKLPGMLRNGIAEICVKEGNETQSVADQDKIKALFPNTYGKKEITFEKGANTSAAKKQVIGVIGRSNLIQRSELDAKTVVEYASESTEAEDYRKLARDIFENDNYSTPEPMNDEDFENFFKSFIE